MSLKRFQESFTCTVEIYSINVYIKQQNKTGFVLNEKKKLIIILHINVFKWIFYYLYCKKVKTDDNI